MESPSSSTRFTLLPTSYLASQPPSSEITLQSLIDTSDRMAEEAREALPYSFDECTYAKGYLRQSVWSCLDCGEKGVCYGCSISCHSEHRLVELWTRRSFRCDCPTSSTQPEPVPPAKRRRCGLYPPHQQPQEPNEKNKYTQNYKGKFCRCGKEYDAETETEAMICCIACEDWFHESCLNLRPNFSSSTQPTQVKPDDTDPAEPTATTNPSSNNPPNSENVVDEEDEEESTVLIRSDSYDGLICADCVKGNGYLRNQAGKDGWMIIEPTSDGSQGGWTVIGQKSDTGNDVNGKTGGGEEVTTNKSEDVGNVEEKGKRKAEDFDEVGEESTKKIRLENGLATPVTASNKSTSEGTDSISSSSSGWQWKGKGDIFLANGVRDQLKDQLDEETIASLPFPLIDEEIYEPPKDDEQEETIEQVTSRVMTSLPRVQAIEALHGYQRLKDHLNTMLQQHVSSGQSVSKADIEDMFEQLKGRRE
ncbi:hypothetical protein V866_008445 [Kwoniella sp. B9012]